MSIAKILAKTAIVAGLIGACGSAQAGQADNPLPDARPLIALQPFRSVTTATAADGTVYSLIDLNHFVSHSFLLERQAAGGVKDVVSLDNPDPKTMTLSVTPQGLAITQNGATTVCEPGFADGRDLFAGGAQPFTPYCQGRLWVRAQKQGFRSNQEAVTGMLRQLGWVGESMINLYKTTVGQDAELESAKLVGPKSALAATQTPPPDAPKDAPKDADVRQKSKPVLVGRGQLGVALAGDAIDDAGNNGAADGTVGKTMAIGRWYPARDIPGVFLSVMAAGQATQEILDSYPDRVDTLDEVERSALVYLMAFDLDRYSLNYTVGTDNPAVGWSSRSAVTHDNPDGPDGFSTLAPFARVGMVHPDEMRRVVSIFAGGFKREHGAFRAGALSAVNKGSHYGFMEDGVIFSRLQPGLATITGALDGTVSLHTWTAADQARLPGVRFARQNGVPLIETDPQTGVGVPSGFVHDWGQGNWSGALNPGTQKGVLRALRAGICLQTGNDKAYLIYGYFTSVTPNAMARVFQAYSCRYAMHLDMNSPDLTYAALFARNKGRLMVEYLNRAMQKGNPKDKETGDQPARFRFLTENDNRDFFSVMVKR